MADSSSNPYDLLRGLETLRSAFASSGTVGDSLPLAVERAGEVRDSIDRLTDEVAALNRNVERALPVVESFDRHFARALPLLESLKQAERGVQWLLRRGSGRTPEEPGDVDSTAGEA